MGGVCGRIDMEMGDPASLPKPMAHTISEKHAITMHRIGPNKWDS